ncbi:MAG: YciI family protein [Thermoleophilaceae bacterium]
MKYLLSIYNDEAARGQASPEQSQAEFAGYEVFTEEIRQRGIMLGGEGLQPTATATTVRVRDGERMITDGPFAETKEQLGGFYLLECKDLDEAIEWAAKIPGAQSGSVEVRPVMVYDAEPREDEQAASASS